MDDQKSGRATINLDEAARQLGIGRNQAYAAADRGEIPTIKIGRRLLVPKGLFEQLLNGGFSPRLGR